jgi:hypothetical protein
MDHYLGLGRLIGDLLGSLDSVELWHTDIENGNIRMLLGDQLYRFPSIASLRYNFEVGLLLEQQSQTRPNDGVIVSEQDANLSQGELLPFQYARVASSPCWSGLQPAHIPIGTDRSAHHGYPFLTAF